jgi:hypothetical protein
MENARTVPQSGHICFLSNPCQVIFCQTLYHQCYTVPDTDRIKGEKQNQTVNIYTVQYGHYPTYSIKNLKYTHLFNMCPIFHCRNKSTKRYSAERILLGDNIGGGVE